jgi:hypothetical protein
MVTRNPNWSLEILSKGLLRKENVLAPLGRLTLGKLHHFSLFVVVMV